MKVLKSIVAFFSKCDVVYQSTGTPHAPYFAGPIGNDDSKAVRSEPKIGDRMPDGTVFAGISPETSKPMYATPADAPLMMKFNKATKYAARLDVHGHQDWRVPTKAELSVLFNNRAAIGGFNISDSDPASWYWSSSSDYKSSGRGQRFSDGYQFGVFRDWPKAVRFVR